MTREMKNISVVVPTLGTRPGLLDEALDTVFRQTLPPIEVLVVHNGVGHARPALPSSVRLIELPPGAGVACARNRGALEAVGEYVAFLDDDDLWDPAFLLEVSRSIELLEPDMVLGRLDLLESDIARPFMEATGLLDPDHVLVMNPGSTGSNTVVRRSSFLEIGGYDPLLPPAEDMGLLADFVLADMRIEVAARALAFLRHHDGDRLTRRDRVARSSEVFYRKYRSHMTWRQRCYSRWRSLDLRVRPSSLRWVRLDYLILSAVVVSIRMRPRDLWPGPSITPDRSP